MSIFSRIFLKSRGLKNSEPTVIRRVYLPFAEILEDRLVPTTTATLVGTTLQIVGDDTANIVTVRLVTGDSTKTEVFDGASSLGSFSNAAFTNINVNLNGGNDSLTIDNSNGNPTPSGGLSYDGGVGANTLIGPAIANTWNITATNAGSLNTTSSFTNIQNLLGGTLADNFQFSTAGSLSGSLDGGGGLNTLDYSIYAARSIVDLSHSAASGVRNLSNNGIANIQAAIGSNASNNLLVGTAADTTWNINSANAGTAISANSTFTFTAFKSLAGGSGSDTFKLIGAAKLDGYADGGAGANTLDYSGYSNRVVIDLAHQAVTGIKNLSGSGIARFQTLVGSPSTTNLLVGSNANATWLVTRADAGSVSPTTYGNVNFSGFAYLTGGFKIDTFKIMAGASVSGALDGRDNISSSQNVLDYSAYGARVVVSFRSNASTAVRNASGNGIFDFQNIIGSTAGNVAGSGGNLLASPNNSSEFSINSQNGGFFGAFGIGNIDFSAFPNLTGGSGNDYFGFGPGITLSGNIDGGAGINTLIYYTWTTSVSVNLTANTANNLAKVFNIQNVLSGSGNDNITGGPNGGYLIGNYGNDTITGGAGRSVIIGGFGSDMLKGGSNDDLIIAGVTNYDVHLDLLLSILVEWQRTDISYEIRVADLRAGIGLSAGNKLVLGKTVFLTGESNMLTGDLTTPIAGELDWFFADLAAGHDVITDPQNGELVN